jgi:hypothetical protein
MRHSMDSSLQTSRPEPGNKGTLIGAKLPPQLAGACDRSAPTHDIPDEVSTCQEQRYSRRRCMSQMGQTTCDMRELRHLILCGLV